MEFIQLNKIERKKNLHRVVPMTHMDQVVNKNKGDPNRLLGPCMAKDKYHARPSCLADDTKGSLNPHFFLNHMIPRGHRNTPVGLFLA